MNFSDIFKRSFLDGFVTSDLSLRAIVLAVGITCVFSLYLFFAYRLVTRKTFYDKSLNIALAVIPVIICGIILTIQSSIVVSLGMVGALSIVRFRTAIKNPMDLVFLFWAIAVGIICGAGLPGIALLITAAISVGIFVLELLPVAKAPLLLIVNASGASARSAILEQVKANSTLFHVKSQTMEADRLDLIVEVRPRNDEALITAVTAIPQVQRCSLISHDGEVTF